MNEYLEIFQKVVQSTEGLLDDRYHSLESPEIKRSALNLQEAVLPKIVELKLFADQLKQSMQGCFAELDHADHVWENKRRISKTSQIVFWQQLGEISGCLARLNQATCAYKVEAIDKAQESWKIRLKDLKIKHFTDSKGNYKEKVGWDEKKRFLADAQVELVKQSEEINSIIDQSLKLILQEIQSINVEIIRTHIKFLDSQTSERERFQSLFLQMFGLLHEPETSFRKISYLSDGTYLISLNSLYKSVIEEWRHKMSDIWWQGVEKYKDVMLRDVETRITLIFDDRSKIIQALLEEAIALYNTLLELQAQYQQETAEKQLAEKGWINQQREELKKVQISLDEILG